MGNSGAKDAGNSNPQSETENPTLPNDEVIPPIPLQLPTRTAPPFDYLIGFSSDSDEERAADFGRQPCKYWDQCYRKESGHLAKYLHPHEFEPPPAVPPRPRRNYRSSAAASAADTVGSTSGDIAIDDLDIKPVSPPSGVAHSSTQPTLPAPSLLEKDDAVGADDSGSVSQIDDGATDDGRTEDGDTIHSDGEESVVSSVAESVGTQQKVRDGMSIHVENLPPFVKEKVVREFFQKAGFRPSRRINLIRRGKKDCACKITFGSEETAMRAANAMTGKMIDGRKVRIRYLPKNDGSVSGINDSKASQKQRQADTRDYSDVQYRGRVSSVSATRIFIESSKDLPGQPPSRRIVFYPPNFYPATLFPLINNDEVTFTLARRRGTPKKETDKPPACNVKILQYAKREKELVESYISTLMERVRTADQSEVTALASSLPTWTLLGHNLIALSMDSLVQLLSVVKKVMTSDSNFVNGSCFKAFVGYKFLHLGNALSTFLKELLIRNRPFELQTVFSFLSSVAANADDPFTPQFICQMSVALGAQTFYRESTSLMDVLRKNKLAIPKKRIVLPTYEELTIIPMEKDPGASVLLQNYVSVEDYLESVTAALKMDLFSRISNTLVAELNSTKKDKMKDSIVLTNVMVTQMKLNHCGRSQFIVEVGSNDVVPVGSLFVMSQEPDFRNFVFGCIHERDSSTTNQFAVEIFPESLKNIDATLVFLPKVSTKMLVVPTAASKYKFLEGLQNMIQNEKNWKKSEVLRVLSEPFALSFESSRAHKQAVAVLKQHAAAGRPFTVAGLELIPRELDILTTILESKVSAIQVHPGADVSDLLLMLLYIVAQETASGPILYLTKEEENEVVIKAALSRILGDEAVVLERAAPSASSTLDRTAELFVKELKKEVENIRNIIQSDSGDLHAVFEKLFVEDVAQKSDEGRLSAFIARCLPDLCLTDIRSFIDVCSAEGLPAARQKLASCDSIIRAICDYYTSQILEPASSDSIGNYKKYFDMASGKGEYSESEYRPVFVSDAWSTVVDLAIGQLASGSKDSEVMYAHASQKIAQRAGNALKELLGRLTQLKEESLVASAEKLSKKRLITVFGSQFHDVFDQISQLSPSMIVISNASLWAVWELLPLIKSSVKQIILLGDINLLNPSVENLHLSRALNYAPSLFEYVYKNQLPAICERLTVFEQDVSRPEMFNLVADAYIPNVLTGKKRKQLFPSGLVHSLFFWNHADPDNQHQGSWVNHGEATRVVTVANYLTENGTSPTDIIIVTPFYGQVAHLRQKLKKMKLNIEVFLIDDCLVRRSNTVLVSLVKSKGDLGILGDHKRRCSLLTRANSAMIIFGNADVLSQNNVWLPVVTVAVNSKCLSNEIPLCCPNHRKTKKNFKLPAEINTALQKPFCIESCKYKFICGHTCNLSCRPEHSHTACNDTQEIQHPVCKHIVTRLCSQDPKDIKCQMNQEVTFKCGHQAKLLCGQKRLCPLECKKVLPCQIHFCKKKCEPEHEHVVCKEDVAIIHPGCGHDGFRKCHESITEALCMKKLEVFHPSCGHTSEKFCYQRTTETKCNSKCFQPTQCPQHPRCELPCTSVEPHGHSVCRGEVEVILSDCGHPVKRICSQPEEVVVCRKEIDMVFKYCRHTQKVMCWERSRLIACKEQCQEFTCKRHRCQLQCEPPHDHPKKCIQEVPFTYPTCKHPGMKPCYLPDRDATAVPCETLIQTSMSCGIHTTLKKCFEARSNSVCTDPCGTLLKCGHKCIKPCQPGHDHNLCLEKVKLRKACGIHFADVLCGIRPDLNCNEEVARQLACGHKVMAKCHEDPESVQCQIMLKKKFSCGHDKMVTCTESRTVTVCLGYPCQKTLPCGHLCSKRCGETCDQTGCPKCKSDMQREEKAKQDAEWNRKKQALEEARKSADKLRFSSSFMMVELERNSPEFISVEDKVTKYIQVSHNWYPTVTKIQKVTNDRLRKGYYECQQELFDPCYSDLKFHGTDTKTINKICTYGFKLPQEDGKRRMYGLGIYFATDSSKSAQDIYTKGSEMLLLCEVLIGKAYTAQGADYSMRKDRLRSLGYDSLYAKRDTAGYGGVRYDEFVIYDERQAFPTYVIQYRTGAMNIARLHSSMPSGGRIRKHDLYPKRTFESTSEEDQHYRIAESQFLRLQQERQSYQQYKLKKVTWVENPTLYNRFVSKQKEFDRKYGQRNESKPILAFHGTPKSENLDLIVEKNFDNSKIARTAYGYGHYFSEFPDVSFGYASGVKKLLLCQLLPGKSYDVTANYNIPPGYDSNRVGRDGSERGQMIIIANVDQILPCYILHFE